MANRSLTTLTFLLAVFAAGALSAQADTWTVESGVVARQGHTSVSFNGRMWIIGGVAAEFGYSTVYKNDVWSSPDGVNWTEETSAAAWDPRSEHASVVYNNRIWVIGGKNGVTAYNDVWSSGDGVNWTLETSGAPWTARSSHAVSVFNSELWLTAGQGANGYFGGGVFNDVWTSTDGINWTQQATPLWTARFDHTAAVLNNELYVMGGSDGLFFTNDVWAYDGSAWSLKTDTAWSGFHGPTATTFFGPRFGMTSMVFNNELWVVAGVAGGGAFSSQKAIGEVWSSPDGVTWNVATTAFGWAPRIAHTTVVFNSRMWVIAGLAGGWSGGLFGVGQPGEEVSDVWSSTNGAIWTEATPDGGFNGWSGREAHTTEVFNSKLWVIGGSNFLVTGTYMPLNDVWSSTDGVNWTEETPAASWQGRRGHSSAVMNGRLWVLGGLAGSTATSGSFVMTNDVWSSQDGANWVQDTSGAGWAGREDHAAVAFNNRLWVMGGFDGTSYRNDIWSSSDGANWTQETSAPGWSARAEHEVVVFSNRLWVLGGWNGVDYFHDIWSSADGTNWTQETSTPAWSGRFGHAATVADGRMWLTGGKGRPPGLWAYGMGYPSAGEFSTSAANVPSGEQSFAVAATSLSADLVITPPQGFEIALVGGNFQSTPISLPPVSGDVSAMTIRVRYNPATAGPHAGDVIIATGNVSRTVPVLGTTVAGTASILLTGGVAPFPTAGMPSAEQTYTVEATNLSANLDVTASNNYEVALVGAAFQPSLSLTPTAGSVLPTVIRVRYNRVGNGGRMGYILHSSTGASDQKVTVTANDVSANTYAQESSDVWSSGDGINWVNEPNAPWSARVGHSLATLNGTLWVLGGGHISISGYITYGRTLPFPGEVWSAELPSIELTSATYSNTEGAGQVVVSVETNRTYAFDVQVDFATFDGTATAPTDYTAANGTVIIPAGQTSADIILSIVDDQVDEPDEDLQITLSNPLYAAAGALLNATVQILDDDGAPTVRFGSSNYSVSESGGQVSIDIELSNVSGYDVQVDFSTADVTASAGLDYTYYAGTVLIPAGHTTVPVMIPVMDDNVFEGSEQFTVQLSNPLNGGLGATSLTDITITDDETSPVIGFVLTQLDVNETDGAVMVEVMLSNPSTQQVAVDFGFLGGTATPGLDFSDVPGTVTFNPGEVSKFFGIVIIDDMSNEPVEIFQVTLINPINGSNGINAALDVTILADANDVSSVGDESGGHGGSGGCVADGGNSLLWLLLGALGLAVVTLRRKHQVSR